MSGSKSMTVVAVNNVGKSNRLNQVNPIKDVGPQWNGVNGITLSTWYHISSYVLLDPLNIVRPILRECKNSLDIINTVPLSLLTTCAACTTMVYQNIKVHSHTLSRGTRKEASTFSV